MKLGPKLSGGGTGPAGACRTVKKRRDDWESVVQKASAYGLQEAKFSSRRVSDHAGRIHEWMPSVLRLRLFLTLPLQM